jgi:hypothetical protein
VIRKLLKKINDEKRERSRDRSLVETAAALEEPK